MAGILDAVDQRTQLVGENRLEILMFRLAGRQLFAINVFKVQEVLQLPKLTLMPQRHPFVCGVVNPLTSCINFLHTRRSSLGRVAENIITCFS